MIYRNNKNKDTYSLSLVGEFVSCLGIRNVPRESQEKIQKVFAICEIFDKSSETIQKFSECLQQFLKI